MRSNEEVINDVDDDDFSGVVGAKVWLEWVYKKKGYEKLGKGRIDKSFKGFSAKKELLKESQQ